MLSACTTVESRWAITREVRSRATRSSASWISISVWLSSAEVASSSIRMEWPPRSGRHQEFPEVDRAAWFSIEEAQRKMSVGQAPFLLQLLEKLEDSERKAEGSAG